MKKESIKSHRRHNASEDVIKNFIFLKLERINCEGKFNYDMEPYVTHIIFSFILRMF